MIARWPAAPASPDGVVPDGRRGAERRTLTGRRHDLCCAIVNPASGYALDPDGGERLVFGDLTIVIRASAEATAGAFTLFEEVPPLADTPLHLHANEDEWFYVLEREHVFQVGDEEFPTGPGGSSSLPAPSRTRSGASSRAKAGCSP